MTEELKNCPHCGSLDVVAFPENEFDNPAVECQVCRSYIFGESPEAAAEAWNKRTPDPALQSLQQLLSEPGDDVINEIYSNVQEQCSFDQDITKRAIAIVIEMLRKKAGL